MKKIILTIATAFAGMMINPSMQACTNYLVTKSASKDGSTMISYAADSHTLYGELYHWPAATYPAGMMLDIYEWDTGKYLGKIKQATRTFNVVGNMNENQVAIGETTYGGRDELVDTTGILDYGSLIYVTLQRATSARDAIKIMTDLVAEYGYCSSGESFSISDPNEVWVLEMIGKGSPSVTKDKKGKIIKNNSSKGAVWVAIRIPDGYVSGHANQARITTFPFQKANNWNDQNQSVYHSQDVITFARSKGYTKADIKDEEFSFSDTYAPVSFSAARGCEMRVWTMFNAVSKDMAKYWDYVKGNIQHDPRTGYATNRMPLYIKPDRKISNLDMFAFMRDHLEGTELDMTKDLGAGPFGCPYRWRPMTYKVDGVEYVNERATATQQTGFSFIAELRSWLPNPIGGVLWFSVDDASSTVYFPMYCGATDVPYAYQVGNGDMMNFSDKSAFWTFSQVSNLAYTRWNLIHADIAAKQAAKEKSFTEHLTYIDKAASELYKTDKNAALKFITEYSVNAGNGLVMEWREFYQELFVKYLDGNVKTKVPGQKNPKLVQPGYGEEWNRRVVKDNGEKLKSLAPSGH